MPSEDSKSIDIFKPAATKLTGSEINQLHIRKAWTQ